MASGVDSDHFRPGASTVESSLLPRPRVIFTGRLHPQKNLPLLLEAWNEVARRSPANLILVGPGNDRQRLEELAGSLGISDRVQFIRCGRRSRRTPPCRRRLRSSQRGGRHEQLALGGHGDRPALRRLGDRRQYRPDRRWRDRPAGHGPQPGEALVKDAPRAARKPMRSTATGRGRAHSASTANSRSASSWTATWSFTAG